MFAWTFIVTAESSVTSMDILLMRLSVPIALPDGRCLVLFIPVKQPTLQSPF